MRRLVMLVTAGAAVTGCSSVKEIGAAQSAVDGFHRQLNAGQFQPIYDASSADMKTATTAAAFDALAAAIHRKLGQFRSGQAVGWNANYNTGGSFVTIDYDATYDRGKATENFTYRIADRKPALVSYNINSDALILN